MNMIQDTHTPAHAQSVPLNPQGVVRSSLGLCAVSLLLCGFAYSLAGVGLGQVAFSQQANGSLITYNGRPVGSALVAQPFSQSQYFHPRPSAANYDLMALAGSNQARTNPDLRQRLAKTGNQIAQQETVTVQQLPSDLLTQSGSGIDPHISPAAAQIQVARVAQVRGLTPAQVQALVDQYTEQKQWGWFGMPRVNVLQLNLALENQTSRHR